MSRNLRSPKARRPLARSQRGVALIVVLILLLIMTLLGLASLRGTLLEERMSASLYDRSLAFQAAEAALREAEALLTQAAVRDAFPDDNSCTATGLCGKPLVTGTGGTQYERWDERNSAHDSFFVDASQVDDKVAKPQYFIEYMGEAPAWTFCDSEVPIPDNCMKPRYRITARGGEPGRARVILQSNYAAF